MLLGKVWFLISLVVALIGLWWAFPHLSVSAGDLLDSKNPYSTLFLVTNEGLIPVTNLEADCHISPLRDNFGNTFETIEIGPQPFAAYLAHAQKASLPCFRVLSLGGNASLSEAGDLTVTVTYFTYPLHILRMHKQFRFRTVRAPNGQMHWIYVT